MSHVRVVKVGDAARQLTLLRITCFGLTATSGQAKGAQVAPDRRADVAGTIGGANDRDRARLEQLVEMADAHGVRCAVMA